MPYTLDDARREAEEKVRTGEERENIFAHDFTLKSEDPSVKETEESESIGPKPSQQDSMFIAAVRDEKAKKDPKTFFRQAIAETVKFHESCNRGTTLCSAIARKEGEDVKITVANLGDSRATLIIRHKNGEYESISLTEDHKPHFDRVLKHIEERGGTVRLGRIIGKKETLATGAAIGDRAIYRGETIDESEVRDCILRDPDIFTFNLSNFLREGESIKNISARLLVACDGLYDFASPDRELHLEGGEIKYKESETDKPKEARDGSGQPYSSKLSKLAAMFDSGEGLPRPRESKDSATSKFNNFADALVNLAYYPFNTGDNVSVANISLVRDGRFNIGDETSIMATVCDGHGNGTTMTSEDDKKQSWDGSVVSASVAADLFVAARCREIKGLEINNEKQKNFSEFCDRRRKIETVIDTPSASDHSVGKPPIGPRRGIRGIAPELLRAMAPRRLTPAEEAGPSGITGTADEKSMMRRGAAHTPAEEARPSGIAARDDYAGSADEKSMMRRDINRDLRKIVARRDLSDPYSQLEVLTSASPIKPKEKDDKTR